MEPYNDEDDLELLEVDTDVEPDESDDDYPELESTELDEVLDEVSDMFVDD